MPIYVTLLHFTERGIHHVKDTVKRSEAYRSRAKKHGATVKGIIWTQGAHDIVTIVEAPDDETARLSSSTQMTGQCSRRPCAASRPPRWKSYWPRSTSDLSISPAPVLRSGRFCACSVAHKLQCRIRRDD